MKLEAQSPELTGVNLKMKEQSPNWSSVISPSENNRQEFLLYFWKASKFAFKNPLISQCKIALEYKANRKPRGNVWRKINNNISPLTGKTKIKDFLYFTQSLCHISWKYHYLKKSCIGVFLPSILNNYSHLVFQNSHISVSVLSQYLTCDQAFFFGGGGV